MPAQSKRLSRNWQTQAVPTYATPASPNRPTRGAQVAKVAQMLGLPLMPHQQLIANVAGELLPDGTPAFREVIVSCMRQVGKTTLVLATSLERCLLRPQPQRVAYTAQTGADARKKLLDDQVPLMMASPLSVAVDRVNRAAGNVGVQFVNGSRIDVIASSVSSGHGKVVDLALLDEAFDDIDDRREQSLLPAMITRREAQLMVVSTMGTDASTYLNRKVDAGRAAALEGRTTGVAYFEFSVPNDADVDDPAVWARHIPALNMTISEAAIRHARQTMSDGEFRRAFCNQRLATNERVIPDATWLMVCDPQAQPGDPVTFAVDVSRERDWCAIVACGNNAAGVPVIELVDYRPGTGWVVDRVAELRQRHAGSVVIESRSPAAALNIPNVTELSASDATQASGMFYDAVADNRLRVRSDARLDAALRAAVKQPVGDVWRFGRKAGSDVCPLVAATFALHGAQSRRAYRFFAV